MNREYGIRYHKDNPYFGGQILSGVILPLLPVQEDDVLFSNRDKDIVNINSKDYEITGTFIPENSNVSYQSLAALNIHSEKFYITCTLNSGELLNTLVHIWDENKEIYKTPFEVKISLIPRIKREYIIISREVYEYERIIFSDQIPKIYLKIGHVEIPQYVIR